MATVTLSAQTVDKDGLSGATYTAIDATDTYSFRNAAKVFLHFKNTGSEATVTLDTPGTVSGEAIANPTDSPLISGDILRGVHHSIAGHQCNVLVLTARHSCQGSISFALATGA